MMTIEYWRDAKKTPAWIYAGLRIAFPSGFEMSESAYDAACDAVKNHVPGRSPQETE